jgi:amino acid permease
VTAITKLLIAFHVLTAYPILMNVFVREIEVGLGIEHSTVAQAWIERKSWPRWKQLASRTVFRTGCVVLTGVIALYIPYFPEFMTLVGAICLTMIVFVLPVVFGWKLRSLTYRSYRISNIRSANDVINCDESATSDAVENGLIPAMQAWEKVLGVFIILVALPGGTVGAIQAVQGIIAKLKAGDHQ